MSEVPREGLQAAADRMKKRRAEGQGKARQVRAVEEIGRPDSREQVGRVGAEGGERDGGGLPNARQVGQARLTSFPVLWWGGAARDLQHEPAGKRRVESAARKPLLEQRSGVEALQRKELATACSKAPDDGVGRGEELWAAASGVAEEKHGSPQGGPLVVHELQEKGERGVSYGDGGYEGDFASSNGLRGKGRQRRGGGQDEPGEKAEWGGQRTWRGT